MQVCDIMSYRIYSGDKKSLVFPIMGDGYVHLDYSKHIPTGSDDPYGLWGHKSSFTSEGIITPYDVNGDFEKDNGTSHKSLKSLGSGGDNYFDRDQRINSAMTLLKVKPESEVLAEVSQRIQEHNQRSILAKVGSGFKAGIRLGLLGLEDAYRSWVDRPINSFIASTFGDQKESLTFQDAYAQSGKSTVRNAINQLRSGQRVNLGQGFLPNSDLFDPSNPNSKFFEEYQYMVKKCMSPDKATQHINNYLGDPITEVDRRMQEESGMFTVKNRISRKSTPISLGRSVANLVMFLAGSTPSTLAHNLNNGSNKTPSLQPISNILNLLLIERPDTSYFSSKLLATFSKCFDRPTEEIYL